MYEYTVETSSNQSIATKTQRIGQADKGLSEVVTKTNQTLIMLEFSIFLLIL